MPKPNKQHDARAASFKRIARDIRAVAKEQDEPPLKRLAREIAKAVETEAMRLRAMR